jgi:hypothetical protein
MSRYVVGRLTRGRYAVDGLQATEPDELTKADGIVVTIDDELDSQGFNTVSVEGPTREAVLAYIRANFGDVAE